MVIRLLATLTIAALFLGAAAEGQVLDRRPDCLKVAVALDVSGSMRPYFAGAQAALLELLGSLRPCDRFHVIPFSETKLPGFSGELTMENRATVLRDAEKFVNGLRSGGRKGDAYGNYTNLDEGVDAATLALLREEDGRKGMMVLISDGLSDPDPNHKLVDLADLGRRIPRGAFNLYLVDLSGAPTHGLEQGQIGSFDVLRVPNTAVIVIPLRQVEALGRLLHELEARDRAEAVEPAPEASPASAEEAVALPLPVEQRPLWHELVWLLPLLAAVAIVAFLLFRRRPRDAENGPIRPRRLLIRIGEEEWQHRLPARLTVGGGDHDAVRAPGAQEAELRLEVSARGAGEFRLNGYRGGFFGTRTFRLSNGVEVEVRVENETNRQRQVHRYLSVH